MSHSPQQQGGSKAYQDAWRAINILIRSDGSWSGRERNVCYRNDGDGSFTDVSFVSGLDLAADGRAFVPVDLDHDGDLDLILKNRNGRRLRAFRNDAPAGRLLTVRLEGAQSNRDGVGARVRIKTDKREMIREVVSAAGYLSQRSRVLHFGLPEGEQVEALTVEWPSGLAHRFDDLPSLGEIVISEAEEKWSEARREAAEVPLASEPANLLNAEGTWLAEPIPAPLFQLEGVEGPWSLEQRRGSKLLLNFWATWCPPCRKELADLREHAEDFENVGLEAVAISVDDPADREKVRRFAEEQRLPFPVLFADDDVVNVYTVLNERLFDRRRSLAIPTSFLVDEQGRVIKVYRGEASARTILADALEGSGPSTPFEGRWVRSGPKRDFLELATAYAERGLLEPAHAIFTTEMSAGAESPDFYNNLAGLQTKQEDYVAATESLRRSLSLDPSQPNAKVNLASALIELGAADEAADLLEEAIAAQADDPQAFGLLGAIRAAQQDVENAERLYRRAIELEPEHAELHESLAALLATDERYQEAIEAYERARAQGADSALLHSNLGVLYMQRGMPANALLAFRRAVAADPEDYGANLNLALYYRQAGDDRNARMWAEKAHDIDPERPEAPELLLELD